MPKPEIKTSKNFGKGSFPKQSEKPKLTNWNKSGPPKSNISEKPKVAKQEPCGNCEWKHLNEPPQKKSNSIEKNLKEDINSFMSNKSLFDRLCEEVLSEEEMSPMGGSPLGAAPEVGGEEVGGEMGAEEEADDSVTLTLDKDTAQKLHDLLASVLGGEEEGEEEGEDSIEELDAEGGEGEEKTFPEGAEIEELGSTADMTKHAAMKTGANLQMGGTTAHNAKVEVQGTPTPAKKFSQPSMKHELPSDIAFKKTGKASSK